MTDRPRVGVSSCLLGQEVRFNGGHKRYRFLADSLDPYVEWVAYCPEVSIGLGTPREAIRLTAAGRLVNRAGTADHTAAMAALPLPADLDGYVFKAKSPSCGIRAIPRYRDAGAQPGGAHSRRAHSRRAHSRRAHSRRAHSRRTTLAAACTRPGFLLRSRCWPWRTRGG